MNLFSFLNHGAAHADILTQRRAAKAAATEAAAVETARALWLKALMADQTRAWLSIGDVDRQLLSAMAILLTIAGFCSVFDARSADTLDLRVFRGAISAATQCSAAGSVVTVADARAFNSACDRARVVITDASHAAIVHAAHTIRLTVGIADVAAPGARAATGVVVAGL